MSVSLYLSPSLSLCVCAAKYNANNISFVCNFGVNNNFAIRQMHAAHENILWVFLFRIQIDWFLSGDSHTHQQ